jgi:phage terminase large subunit
VSSRTKVVGAATALVARVQAAKANTLRVLWAGIDESATAFAARVKRAAPAQVICVAPHGYTVPADSRAVYLPLKLFRLFHPTRPSRYRVAHGGRGSAKSWTIARVLLLLALERPLRVLCAREFQKSIAESAHRLLEDQINSLGLARFFTVQNQSITSITGSEFIFEGLHANVNKIKSLEGIDICWVEEAAKVSANSWAILTPTIRKPKSEIWVNFNPEDDDDPTYQRFVIKPSPDAAVLHVTYADNPWFPPELERERLYDLSVDAGAHAHVWLGQCRRQSDAQILKGKIVVEAFTPPALPPDATQEQRDSFLPWNGPYQGADWGFSQDPTTLVRCWVTPDRRKLYIEYESYGVGVDIDKTPAMFARDVPNAAKYRTRADSARPETISYMQKHGFPEVVSVKKRPGSVEDGVSYLRHFEEIIIHPRCTHAIEEGRLYSFKVDRLSGDVLPDVADKHNHIWDAVRYALEPLISEPGIGLLTWLMTPDAIDMAAKQNEKRDRQSDAGVVLTQL